MGQQQLLLVILVTIIVGIATVVAINTFGTAANQANEDAVRNDVATLASAAQGFYMKPKMLGGGSRTFNSGGDGDAGISFSGLAFPADGISTDLSTAQNENGRYTLSVIDSQSFGIVSHPSSCDGYSPATITSGVLNADGGDCTSEDDQINATVGPNTFTFNT